MFKMTMTFANNTGDITGLPIRIIANQRQETWPMAARIDALNIFGKHQ